MPHPDDADRSAGSPAVVLTAVFGLLGLLLALNAAAFALSLFLSSASLATLPMALADRPAARTLRFALLGAASAVLALALVLVPLLTGQVQRDVRTTDPARTGEETPSLPEPAPPRSATPTPAP